MDMSNLVSALESAWLEIGSRHPQLPPVIIRVGSGRNHTGSLDRHGHFSTAHQWHSTDPTQPGAKPEVMISGESLDRGAEGVFGTLLHEAVHAINWARQVSDTSRQGRYHNQRFRRTCELVLLNCDKDRTHGWAITSLSDSARERYANAMARIDRALRMTLDSQHVASAEGATAAGKSSRNNTSSQRCACGRCLRGANSTWAQGDVVCALCMTTFSDNPAVFSGRDQATVNELTEHLEASERAYTALHDAMLTGGAHRPIRLPGVDGVVADTTSGRAAQMAAEMAIDDAAAPATADEIAAAARALVQCDTLRGRCDALAALVSMVNRHELSRQARTAHRARPDGRFQGLDLD